MTDPDATRWEGGRVTCPACQREGYTDASLNLCGGCTRWFAVEPGARIRTELLADAEVAGFTESNQE